MTRQELEQKTQDFMNKYMWQFVDQDGYPSYQPYQCVDPIRKFQLEVVRNPLVPGNARDYWYNYPLDRTLQQYYDRIPNTPTAVPQLGDIVIFNNGPFGHIAICTKAAGLIYFTTFDQNYPGKSIPIPGTNPMKWGYPCQYVAHNFFWWSPKVIGWLRPKTNG